MTEGRYPGTVELAYSVVGEASGEPVVLLPGLTATRTSWNAVRNALSRRSRVYSVDLRGHGESAHGPADAYVLEQYVADTIAFCRDVVQAPAMVVGHSLGAVIAFEVARVRPDLARRIVMIDPPLYGDAAGGGGKPRFTPPFRQLRDLLRSLHAREAGLDEYESVFGSLPLPTGVRPAAEVLDGEGLRELAVAQASLDPEVLTPAIEGKLFAGGQPDAAIDPPLLVLRADPGSGSAIFTEADSVRLRRNNPNAAVETMTGSGHAALSDAGSQVSEHLMQFISGSG